MFIESIELSDYRNYSHLHIDFHKGTNVLYGDNAQGKTNILEAVYVCSTTKSHRGSKDKEMIRFGADESHIKMMVRRDGIPYRIDMHLKKNKAKGVAVNGVPIKKASELFGIVNVIFFSPEDLNIIKNGPAERRRFVDLELCQLNRLYVYNLAQYNKTVIQRNKLLKDIDHNTSLKETLPMWNEQLLKYGTELIIMRSEFIKELNPLIAEIELVKKIVKDYPVLLLDDVLSELDSKRQEHLLSEITHIQTLITCTGLDEFVNSKFRMDKIFKIVEGTVESED